MGEQAGRQLALKEVLGSVPDRTASLLLLLSLAGCANPGPPRPPSLQLAAVVTDLSASRVGDHVLLRWTTPSKTADNLEVRGPLRVEICRNAGEAAPASKIAAQCTPVKTIPTVPGAASASDDLPQSLLGGPARLLEYRIQILNLSGKSAGRSAAAFAVAGAAPPPVETLAATVSEAGAVLKWRRPSSGDSSSVDLFRRDLSAAPSPARKSAGPAELPLHRGKQSAAVNTTSEEAAIVHLRAAVTSGKENGIAGTVDATATMGHTYSYVAQQIQLVKLDGHTLELQSEPSAPVTLTMRDTFPPRSPKGLATIPGTSEAVSGRAGASYIDLSWEPDTEPDLVGYLVYRQLTEPGGNPDGPIGKLTPSPIAGTAYRDVAIAVGQRYSYLVTAVDASGNESAPSARAQEVAVAPDAGYSP